MPNETRCIRISVQVGENLQSREFTLPVSDPTTPIDECVAALVARVATTLYYLACGAIEADIRADQYIWALYNPAPQEREC